MPAFSGLPARALSYERCVAALPFALRITVCLSTDGDVISRCGKPPANFPYDV